MFQLKNRQSNSLEMAIELLQTNLKLNKMSIITNKLNDFLKANDGKLEVSLKDLYQLFSEISLMEISSKNIQTGAAIIFGGNVSKTIESAIEKNTIVKPIYKNETELTEKSIECLSLLNGFSREDAIKIIQRLHTQIDINSRVLLSPND